MAVLYGTMQNGQLVAVEADAQGRLVAELANPIDPDHFVPVTGGTMTGNLTVPSLNGGTPDTLERAGNVIQVVHSPQPTYLASAVIMPLDNTIPQNTEGAVFMTAAITPTSATSKLLITVNAFFVTENPDWITSALFQDAGVNALASYTTYQGAAGGSANSNFSHYMTAGTTSETTFFLRAGQSTTGTTRMNGNLAGARLGGTSASAITVMEIAA